MWCLKCFWEHQGRVVLQWRVHNQVFQDREFLIDCHDKLLQILNREDKSRAGRDDAARERRNIPSLIFCSDAIFIDVIDDEPEGGGGGGCAGMFSTGVPFVQTNEKDAGRIPIQV